MASRHHVGGREFPRCGPRSDSLGHEPRHGVLVVAARRHIGEPVRPHRYRRILHVPQEHGHLTTRHRLVGGVLPWHSARRDPLAHKPGDRLAVVRTRRHIGKPMGSGSDTGRVGCRSVKAIRRRNLGTRGRRERHDHPQPHQQSRCQPKDPRRPHGRGPYLETDVDMASQCFGRASHHPLFGVA